MGKKAYTFYWILGSLLPLLLLFGCSFGEPTNPFTGAGSWTPDPPRLPQASNALGVLNWTAGLAILGGLIAMVITAGRMGYRATAIGILLVILSYAISAYLHLLMIPVGIFLTIVSAIWGWSILVKAWRARK